MVAEVTLRHIWLSLGSNQGDRLKNLNRAVEYFLAHPKIQLLKCSPVYETEFAGTGFQDDYLNACVEIASALDLFDLLEEFQALEKVLGRPDNGHMKPRPLDVDFLLVDDLVSSDKRLILPHPRLHERLFVLAALNDLAPLKKIPNSGETVSMLCAKIRRKDGSAVVLRPDLLLEPALPGRNMEE